MALEHFQEFDSTDLREVLVAVGYRIERAPDSWLIPDVSLTQAAPPWQRTNETELLPSFSLDLAAVFK